MVDVTFHCPGSMVKLSAAAETVSTGSKHNKVIPYLIIRPSF
jgi:hypothetical protein